MEKCGAPWEGQPSSEQNRGSGDLRPLTEVCRVLFSIIVTALVALTAYFAIRWLMVLHH
jgi:hypothetical protein